MAEVLTAANVMNATGENSEGIEGVSEMLEGLQKYSKPNPQGDVALQVNSQRSFLMPLITEKLANRKQPSEIQPSPSGKSSTSSSKLHSCKRTITQAATREADMEKMVPKRKTVKG